MSARFTKKDVLFCAFLGLFSLYLFREIILGGHFLFGSDFNAFYLGMKQFLYDEIHTHHSVPFWNPYIFGGMPFWAHFESSIFYPLGYLFWLIPTPKAYGYTMFLHLIVAGLFMYLLARSFAICRAGSLVAGVVFMGNGFIMALLYLGHLCPVQSYVWLPIVIYFVNRAVISKTPYVNAVFAGTLWGVQILAGAPQDAYYTFIATFIFLACQVKHPSEPKGYVFRFLAVECLVFLMGTGIAAIQIVPALELVSESVRTTMDTYELVTQGSYPPEGIITTLMPSFFGDYTRGSSWVAKVPWSVPQENLYMGIAPLLFLIFVSNGPSVKRRLIVFSVILAAISLSLALGHHTSLYRLAYLLPGFDRFRSPSRIIVLWMFAGSILAGLGMNDLLHQRQSHTSRRLTVLSCLVIGLLILDLFFHLDRASVLKFFSPFLPPEAIPGKMGIAEDIIRSEFHRFTLFCGITVLVIIFLMKRVFSLKIGAAVLCMLLLLDLGYVHGPSIKHDDRFYVTTAALKHDLDATLGKDRSTYRVGSFQSSLGPNVEMVLGYQTVGGFTALFLNRFYEYINHYSDGTLPEGWQYFFYGRHPSTRLMDLMNVKYELSYATGEYALRQGSLPRAFMVPNQKVIRKNEVLDSLKRPDFDPTRTVLFEEDSVPQDLKQHPHREHPLKGQAEIISYRPDQISLRVESPEPGYLFLSEIFYPGWKAFVDDQPQRIMRGNYLFRILEIASGSHLVLLVFDSLSIKIGIGITIATLFMLMGVVLYHFRKKTAFKGQA